jgi:hypothetical protein
MRFEHDERLPDLTEAIEALREAVALLPASHSHRPGLHSNLGLALHHRYQQAGEAGDLDESIRLLEAAVADTPVDHPDRVMYLTNLSAALESRFDRTRQQTDGRMARDRAMQAVGLRDAPVHERVKAGLTWGRISASTEDWADAADGYSAAIDLFPLLAWRGISRSSRQHLLEDWQMIANDGAACAIAAGDPERALQMLEAGRAVLWSQLLESRADLAMLRSAAPELAAELLQLREQLEVTTDTEGRIALARNWDDLMSRIRSLPDFNDFAAAPPVDALYRTVTDGSVVVVNVSRWRCDALIATAAGVRSVHLAKLNDRDALQRSNEYLAELQIFEQVRRDEGVARIGLEQVCTSLLEWLWDTVAEPALTACGHLGPPSADHWPRVWWCLTGALAALPVHAAGYHDPEDLPAHRCVLDRVVSSYTPTLRVLTLARSAARPSGDDSMLVIALPTTPGQPDLPDVTREQAVLADRLPGGNMLAGSEATHDAIMAGLTRHRWVHAACHGTQHLADPDRGGLVPYDWQAAGLISIADVTASDRSGGEFIFLSACKTATTGVRNLDEIITLAAGLHYAGWRHVIGTFWSVWDNASADIAALLYPALTPGGRLEPGRSAEALHAAVRAYRAFLPYQPSKWMPFIHIGP